VFCECGTGNLVPWESTAPEPAAQPVETVELPPVPQLAPLSFDVPAAPSSGKPRVEDDVSSRKRGKGERRDPNYCFNHQHVARSGSCEDCDENFCSECLVQFQGAMLCAPCKNFRVRKQEAPPVNST